MPKLFAVRWPIGLFVAVSLIAGTVGFATTLSSRADTAPRDDYAGERQQLLFFKAAVGRIDEELRLRNVGTAPSLRSEREAVLRRMREVAGRMPPERLPPDIAALLPPVAAVEAAPRPVQRPAPMVEVRAWRTGLGTKQAEIDFSNLALDPLPPLPLYVERAPRRAEHARDDETGEKHAERPARERPAKEKTEKPTKETPPTERVVRERPSAERAVADRPPVTVERTAVADQPKQQPVR